MMIVYRSNAGCAKRYAELLAAQTGCRAAELAKAKDFAGEDAVFLGWIMSREIQGLQEARRRFHLLAIAGVGMLDEEEEVARVRENAAPGEAPFFFLPGNFHVENVTGVLRLAMRAVQKSMRAEAKKSGDPEAQAQLAKIEAGVDKFDEKALAPLTAFLRERLPE